MIALFDTYKEAYYQTNCDDPERLLNTGEIQASSLNKLVFNGTKIVQIKRGTGFIGRFTCWIEDNILSLVSRLDFAETERSKENVFHFSRHVEAAANDVVTNRYSHQTEVRRCTNALVQRVQEQARNRKPLRLGFVNEIMQEINHINGSFGEVIAPPPTPNHPPRYDVRENHSMKDGPPPSYDDPNYTQVNGGNPDELNEYEGPDDDPAPRPFQDDNDSLGTGDGDPFQRRMPELETYRTDVDLERENNLNGFYESENFYGDHASLPFQGNTERRPVQGNEENRLQQEREGVQKDRVATINIGTRAANNDFSIEGATFDTVRKNTPKETKEARTVEIFNKNSIEKNDYDHECDEKFNAARENINKHEETYKDIYIENLCQRINQHFDTIDFLTDENSEDLGPLFEFDLPQQMQLAAKVAVESYEEDVYSEVERLVKQDARPGRHAIENSGETSDSDSLSFKSVELPFQNLDKRK